MFVPFYSKGEPYTKKIDFTGLTGTDASLLNIEGYTYGWDTDYESTSSQVANFVLQINSIEDNQEQPFPNPKVVAFNQDEVLYLVGRKPGDDFSVTSSAITGLTVGVEITGSAPTDFYQKVDGFTMSLTSTPSSGPSSDCRKFDILNDTSNNKVSVANSDTGTSIPIYPNFSEDFYGNPSGYDFSIDTTSATIITGKRYFD